MTLNELYNNKKQQSIEQFVDYLLNRMKRDTDTTITFHKGYMMAGYRTFIYNDKLISRSDAKNILISECQNIQN